MAYNTYYPNVYQPQTYYNPYTYQPMQQQQAMMQQAQQQSQQQAQQPTIQQSGFVLVQSEQEARSYPVAPGNSITFKDETAPFCYVKTMGFNQLDRPIFERYRLVKEDTPSDTSETPTKGGNSSESNSVTYDTKREIGAIWREIDALKAQIEKSFEKRTVSERESEAKDNE